MGGYINERTPAASGHLWCPPLGGMDMTEPAQSEAPRIATAATPHSATADHVRRWLTSAPAQAAQAIVEQHPDLATALASLDDFESDIIAVAAAEWYALHPERDPDGLQVVTALPRRDENHVLIAEDRIDHLPYKAVILSRGRLARRQLRRYRDDFRVLSPKAFADEYELPSPVDIHGIELVDYLESLRTAGTIDGYVTSLHTYDESGTGGRRHRLFTDPMEGDDKRFLPTPLHGLTLFISRIGFPLALAEQLGDKGAHTAWQCERILLFSQKTEHRDKVGMVVRHRQVASLLRQADEERDLMRAQALLDEEGEVRDHETKVEIIIEAVSRRGDKTLLLERLMPISEALPVTRVLAGEWRKLLVEMLAPHDAHPRLGEARPPFMDL